MNEDLEFIQTVIKEEIKTWTGYRREIVEDVGEEEFIKDIGFEVQEFILDMDFSVFNKEIILEALYLIIEDFNLNPI